MSLWIDPPRWPAHGRQWSHLISDDGLDELHAMASRLGLPSRAFDGDHYDVPEELYAAAVAAGARPTASNDLIRRLHASGLRLSKRKGDKGIRRVLGVEFPDGAIADIDLVRSSRPVRPERVFAAVTFVRDGGGDFAVTYSARRRAWSSPGGWREADETPAENAVRELWEETGLEIDPGALEPCGYERVRVRSGPALTEGRDVIQAYRIDLAAVHPEMTPGIDDGSAPRWVGGVEFAQLGRGQFWWPLAAAVFGSPDPRRPPLPAGDSHHAAW